MSFGERASSPFLTLTCVLDGCTSGKLFLSPTATKPNGPRNCWNKDSKALKFFIACIVCVILQSSSLSKLNDCIRIMAATQTAVNVYSMYWWDGRTHGICPPCTHFFNRYMVVNFSNAEALAANKW